MEALSKIMTKTAERMRMRMTSSTLFLLMLLSYTAAHNTPTPKETKAIIQKTLEATQKVLDDLFVRWQIKQYPNFLNSVEMSLTSWEVMKLKMQQKLLSSSRGKTDEKFVVSFLGSSVTAGHDSRFNQSFSEVTRVLMKPAFDAAGIQLQVINGAMGNNPCLPYDICVKTFAGLEADIIHWEQVKKIL